MKNEKAQPTGRTGLPAGQVVLAKRPVNQQNSAGNCNHWTVECDPEACYACNTA